MHIGETVRLLAVEPLVDPVPAPDDPGRPCGSADVVPAPAGDRDDREPVPAPT